MQMSYHTEKLFAFLCEVGFVICRVTTCQYSQLTLGKDSHKLGWYFSVDYRCMPLRNVDFVMFQYG